jgi:hypothetical protein
MRVFPKKPAFLKTKKGDLQKFHALCVEIPRFFAGSRAIFRTVLDASGRCIAGPF